jgi:competence protein ComEC
MKALKYPIITITLFLALGIVAGRQFQPGPVLVAIFSAVALILVAAAYWKANKSIVQKSSFGAAAYLFSFSVGLFSYSVHYAPNNKLHYSHFVTDNAPLIKGIVAERLKPNEFSEKYYFEIISLNKKPVTGRILLTVPIDSTNNLLHAGDVFIIAEGLHPISRSLNPYQFDYAAYMAGQNIFYQVKLKDNFIAAGEIHTVDYYLDNLRNTLMQSFEKHHYHPETINIIKALLLGQRQDMDAITTANYTNAGVVHILAISGLHIAVLFYILNLILKPLRRFNKRGRLLQLIVILAFLWLFAFISGLSASVVRSVVMFSFVSVGLYFNRNSNIYNSIVVSMLFLLLAKPGFLFDVGFQLSYAAVFAIVWLQPIYKKLSVSKYKIVNYLADTVLISLVAQIGVLPLSLYYFNQFPLLFLLANVVIIPLSTAVLIIGIIVLLLNFIWVDLAVYTGRLLEWLIVVMNKFIAWIASFDSLVLKNIPFTLLLNVSLYVVFVVMVLWLYKKSFKRTATLITAITAFQFLYLATAYKAENTEELVVFSNWRKSVIAVKKSDTITLHSNDSLAAEDKNSIAYNKGNFNQRLKVTPLGNVLWFKKNKILILDSLGVYDSATKPDVLILTQSPKINLDRMLGELRPKQVIADATNYKTYTKRWAATCRKEKIPFHATAEKGFYKIE